MKKKILYLFILTVILNTKALGQKIQGSFERIIELRGEKVTEQWKFVDRYFVVTAYDEKNKAFYYTYGGPFYIQEGVLKSIVSFSQYAPLPFRSWISHPIEISKNNLDIKGLAEDLTRIDGALNQPLSQTWVITGRKVNDSIRSRELGARKTLKILSDSQFQWIAFNDETGEFKGSGGGTYEALDGDYIEHIKFFSRDSSRVGQSLSFQFKKTEEDWIHYGLSSKGKAIYEIWTPLSLAERKKRQ